jgi:hypothetical protein
LLHIILMRASRASMIATTPSHAEITVSVITAVADQWSEMIAKTADQHDSEMARAAHRYGCFLVIFMGVLGSRIDGSFADFNALYHHVLGALGVVFGDERSAFRGGCGDHEWFAVTTNECHCVPV